MEQEKNMLKPFFVKTPIMPVFKNWLTLTPYTNWTSRIGIDNNRSLCLLLHKPLCALCKTFVTFVFSFILCA